MANPKEKCVKKCTPSMVDFSKLSFSVWMRCPKHVSFCFHISTSNVHGGLISSSTDLFVTEGGRRLCFHPCLSVSVSICLSACRISQKVLSGFR